MRITVREQYCSIHVAPCETTALDASLNGDGGCPPQIQEAETSLGFRRAAVDRRLPTHRAGANSRFAAQRVWRASGPSHNATYRGAHALGGACHLNDDWASPIVRNEEQCPLFRKIERLQSCSTGIKWKASGNSFAAPSDKSGVSSLTTRSTRSLESATDCSA